MKELPTPTFALSPIAMPRGSLHPHFQVFPVQTPAAIQRPVRSLSVSWAKHQDDIRQAQALRYQIFALEMGALLPQTVPGHDIDFLDDYCEHLLVRDLDSQAVIGTYRVLTPTQAIRAGKTYSDTEFDLSHLSALRPYMVELGRSCVHAEHRDGSVILALWSALAEFMLRNQLHIMIGCASIPMQYHGLVNGHAAAAIWRQLKPEHFAAPPDHVTPHLALPVEQWDDGIRVEPPALVKGYLRLGAKVLGPPAWDPDFNTADLPLMMRIADLPARYRKHFSAPPA